MINYTGFSSKNIKAINDRLTGKDLVVEDLLNEIMTRKGERIMMPRYGSIIHDLIFEPLTTDVRGLVEDDLREIINNDPRAEAISIRVYETDHTLSADIQINILPANEVELLQINIER